MSRLSGHEWDELMFRISQNLHALPIEDAKQMYHDLQLANEQILNRHVPAMRQRMIKDIICAFESGVEFAVMEDKMSAELAQKREALAMSGMPI